MNQSQKDRKVRQQIRAWRDDLINLTRRNALLYYKPTRSSTLEILEPGVHDLLLRMQKTSKNTWSFYEPPPPPDDDEDERSDLERKPLDPSEVLTQKRDASSLNRTLRGLDRQATQEYLDKGLWVLYLGAGMLEWVDPDSKESARSPLVLFPVVITRDNPRAPFVLALGEDDAVANPALAVKFDTDFGIEFPRFEDADDLRSYFSAIAELPELRRRGWAVRDESVIRTFSFHKEVMYRDLQLNEEAIAGHPVARALALGPDADGDLAFDPISERDLDDRCPPEDLIAILDADATQRRCLAAAASGRSFVMDGPPGTGKSQTIANLIASSIHAGKSVLFVSEKAAALDVVSSRLEDLGLGEYLLELHSHKATRKQFAQGMATALKRQPQPPKRLSPHSLAEARRARQQLSAYAVAMNEQREPFGRDLHWVLGRLSQLKGVRVAPVPSGVNESLSAESFAAVLAAAARMSRAWGPVERGEGFVWHGTTLSGTDMSEVQRVSSALGDATESLAVLRAAAHWVAEELLLDLPATTLDVEWELGVLELLEGVSSQIPSAWLTEKSFGSFRDLSDRLQSEHARHKALVETLVSEVGPSWESLDPGALAAIQGGRRMFSEIPGIIELSDTASHDEVLATSAAFERTADLCERLGQEGDKLALRLDAREATLTIGALSELSDVATIIGASPRPDARWLNPFQLEQAQTSASALEAAVSDFSNMRESLGATFTDDVLDLELEDLVARFEQRHKGVRKLGGAYRADKRAVASTTRTGKCTKSVIDQLPDALAWKRVWDRWKLVEVDHADALGSIYYRGESTDWSATQAAFEVCQRVLDAPYPRVSAEVLRQQFSVQGDPSSEARDLGESVRDLISELHSELRALAGAVDSGASAEHLHIWAEKAFETLIPVVEGLRHVDSVSAKSSTLADVDSLAASLTEVLELRARAAEEWEAHRGSLGELYAGLETRWADLDGMLTRAESMRELFGGPVSAETSEALVHSALTTGVLRDQSVAWRKAMSTIAGYFGGGDVNRVTDLLEGDFDDAQTLLGELRSTTPDISEWAAFAEARGHLDDEGLGEVTAFCVNEALDAPSVVETVERAVLTRWADAVINGDDRLTPERRKDRDAIVAEFRRLDQDLKRHAVANVVHACNDRRPSTTTIGPAALILREGQKKTRHRPIRSLMAEAREVIQAVKPCFMMSPMTVSQYLDPETRFDLVIFDEASQVLPADAINCIYRGNQVIIAGDQKQLPPTSFFQRMDDTDESAEFDDEELDSFESILDIAKGSGLESLPLLWHYRSQHEGLIAFSNFSFYGGDLVTYPGSSELGAHVGVESFRVQGVYRRGTTRDNPIEAEKVAERVIFHAQHHPQLTVGVVAFSEAQASLIEDVVDRARRIHPELDDYFTDDRLSGFFVKNLENVQGDERDIMIFSIGYGPDEFGAPVKGNFGPLTRQGGERRLNVAVTRARQRVEVVSSIGPSDFLSSWSSAGARHLKRYLDYAERGIPALALDLEDSESGPESPFEESVISVIRSWGYDVVPQVGTAGYRIDIGVRDLHKPGDYALGIECDGAMYHSSAVARDRDRLRQEVLERLGWRIYRIWGTSWYRNRAKEEQALRGVIESAMNGERAGDRSAPAPRISVPVESVAAVESPRWVKEYEIAKLYVPSHLDMSDGSAQPALRNAIEQVVNRESPVHESVVLGRVREAWGAGRAGNRMRTAFDTQLRILVRNNEVVKDRKGFLWSSDSKKVQVRQPQQRNTATRRTVRQIAPEELRMAIVLLLQDALGADQDELTALAARLFGWERRGEDIAQELDGAVSALLRSGEIVRDGTRLRVASQ